MPRPKRQLKRAAARDTQDPGQARRPGRRRAQRQQTNNNEQDVQAQLAPLSPRQSNYPRQPHSIRRHCYNRQPHHSKPRIRRVNHHNICDTFSSGGTPT
nr:uncharacterized protein LOC117680646 isoform X2 [Crassostrea gigas]XP_034308799.1 uncharacterized protein LOC117680646 isoform X2 [Crassostrea gigas]